MRIIHDDACGGIMMIPLIVDWNIPQICQIRDCEEKTTTIVCFDETETPTGKPLTIGICEKHHQEATKEDKFYYTVDIGGKRWKLKIQ